MKTIIRGGNGDTAVAAVEAAHVGALAAALDDTFVMAAGNPELTGVVTAMSVIQVDSNPTVPMAGKRWYEAVVAVSFRTPGDR